MNHMIISNFYGGHILGFEFYENKPVRIHVFDRNNILGNIYCGYVKDVAKNINAAFIKLDDNKKGYLSLENYTGTIHQGDKVLVQVSGDKIKGKDYTLTCNINLKSDDLILTSGNKSISISKKIKDKSVRERLKGYVSDYEGRDFGFIFRTSSEKSDGYMIKNQADKLAKQWECISQKYIYLKAGSLVYSCNHMAEICRNYVKKENSDIITDSEWVYSELKNAGIEARFHVNEKISLSNIYSLDTCIKKITGKKVYMKSGGYIVIEPTEALTVIDVNTGKAEHGKCKNETVKKINEEALAVIMQQIRLRNLSGIIIVDFINMIYRDDYTALETKAKAMAKNDFCTCTVEGFTKLGLMEISRMKREKPIHEIIKSMEE